MTDISNLTTKQYQELVRALVIERGFGDESIPEVFTLLVEEVGELAKAIRKQNGQKVDLSRKQHDVEEEAADVFWLLLDLCNRLDIDLGKAFDAKETLNSTRNWSN
jgi:NTP pyrophosphatase (non-canonical NTP hydrolase)